MNLRDEILALTAKYHASQFPAKSFVPGTTSIPANGKVVDADDLRMLVDASLDLWLTAGRFADDFEKALAAAWGVRYSLFVNSGSSANLVAFSALTSPLLKDRRLQPGDEMITPASGFPTTVNPGIQYGMVPVFIDVDSSIHNVTPELVEAAITPKTKLVMIAHTLGNPYDAKRIAELCAARGIWFVEDCCDALGAKVDGQAVGTFGNVATCSFYPAHHITTGEGGAVVTKSPVLKKIAESFRDWGRDCYCAPGKENTCGKRYAWRLGDMPYGYDHKYIYSHIGFNLKATDMQAAVGLSQLKKLDAFIARRVHNFKFLHRELMQLGGEEFFEFPTSLANAEPSWFGFLLTLKNPSVDRPKLLNWLSGRNIGTRLLFGGDLTKQPAYLNIERRIVGDLRQTKKIMERSFYVGIWPGLTEEMLSYVAKSLMEGVRALLRA